MTTIFQDHVNHLHNTSLITVINDTRGRNIKCSLKHAQYYEVTWEYNLSNSVQSSTVGGLIYGTEIRYEKYFI